MNCRQLTQSPLKTRAESLINRSQVMQQMQRSATLKPASIAEIEQVTMSCTFSWLMTIFSTFILRGELKFILSFYQKVNMLAASTFCHLIPKKTVLILPFRDFLCFYAATIIIIPYLRREVKRWKLCRLAVTPEILTLTIQTSERDRRVKWLKCRILWWKGKFALIFTFWQRQEKFPA